MLGKGYDRPNLQVDGAHGPGFFTEDDCSGRASHGALHSAPWQPTFERLQPEAINRLEAIAIRLEAGPSLSVTKKTEKEEHLV